MCYNISNQLINNEEIIEKSEDDKLYYLKNNSHLWNKNNIKLFIMDL